MSRSADESWLSKTNRADPQNGLYASSAPESRNQPLTERDGVRLREEVRDIAALDDGQPLTWRHTVQRWRDYIKDSRDTCAVFENVDGDQVRGSNPHRFSEDYSNKQYAKLKDLERGLAEDYGKRLHTAMLTFTASAQPSESHLPPVDHLDSLLSSWDAIRRALGHAVGNRRFERLAILEPHPGDGPNNGYLHIHLAVFVDGYVSRETFEPVIEAHLRNCDHAEAEAHDTTDDSTISVRHAGADREADDEVLDELAIYLAEYLGCYEGDPLDAPEFVQAANALLWATNRQRWRPSNGAQQHMAANQSDGPSEWELVGIENDGEFYETTASGGGVDTFVTNSSDRPPPDDSG